MKKKLTLVLAASSALALAGASQFLGSRPAFAEQAMPEKMMTIEVKITNMTRGQPFSPPIVAAHTPGTHLFQVGQPATPALQMLAEEGMNGDLAKMCETAGAACKAAGMDDKIMPGKSMTFKVSCKPGDVISVAAMLGATNDAFTGLDSVSPEGKMMDGKMLPEKMPMDGKEMEEKKMEGGMMMAPESMMMMKDGVITAMTMAYDAGTEENSEKKSDTAGPDMGKGHPATTPPQPIGMHKGIMGTGDLDKAKFGWEGPVAKIEIKMMK